MKVRVRVTQILILVVFIAIWWFIAYVKLVSPLLLPGPYEVGVTLVQLFTPAGSSLLPGGIWPQLSVTILEIAGAVGLSVAIAIPLGFIIGLRRTVADIYEPILYVLYSIPTVVLYPIIYLVVGVGPTSKILFGALLAVFVLTINTIAGVRQVKVAYLRLSKSLGLSSRNTLVKVVVPAAAPQVISGLRQCLALAILGVVVGEILASNKGLGFVISNASLTFESGLAYAAIVLVLILSFILIQAMRLIEGRFASHVA